MNGRMKISIVSGIIVGLAIAATLHNYSNYKKEKAIETDESSSITSADHNETTNVATTAKTTTTTTTVTTTTAASQTTTTTSSKVPIKWVKTDTDQIVGEYKIEATQWDWEEEDLPSKFSISNTHTINSPTPHGSITWYGCDFSINVSFNSDAQERDLVVMVYDDAFREDGEELGEYKITYSKNSPQATITGSVNILDKKIVIKSKNAGKELKTISVNLNNGGEWISSNTNIIEFFEEGYTIHNTGKVKISYKSNGKIVASKDVEIVE